ncbi:MAG TPA: MarR family transcriptional regulator [Solirubrobacteraceae bacterium]|nr:MarR family transcriptional regulator [Solirubrobacteraceae bacterium]
MDAILAAGRAIVAMAGRSLAELDQDVTLAQHRVLSELAERGPQRVADLAEILNVDRSTATRMCDRLVRKQLVHRRRVSGDRRGVRIAVTSHGRDLVEAVADLRRDQASEMVRRLPDETREAALVALRAFAAAAGEAPEQAWTRGWHTP